jgi:hypothetical protein
MAVDWIWWRRRSQRADGWEEGGSTQGEIGLLWDGFIFCWAGSAMSPWALGHLWNTWLWCTLLNGANLQMPQSNGQNNSGGVDQLGSREWRETNFVYIVTEYFKIQTDWLVWSAWLKLFLDFDKFWLSTLCHGHVTWHVLVLLSTILL